MSKLSIPINKGNYSLDTLEREEQFYNYLSEGWEEEYFQYRTNWVKFAQDQYVADYPLLVDLELASICNLACPMCYTITDQFKSRVNAKLMDYDLFKKVIDEIEGHVPAVRLSLRGESTLNSHFIDCICYAHAKGIKEISFLTNGSKFTPDYFAKVMKAGASWITISFDGLGNKYEEIRSPNKFDEMLANIKEMKRIKQRYNTHKPVIKIQSIWPAIKTDPQAFYDTFAPHVDLVAFNPLIDYLGKDTDILYDHSFSCPQLYQRLVIGADGKVMMCANDEDSEIEIGNANTQSVRQIWHGEKLQEFRDIQKSKCGFKEIPICRKCYLPRLTTDDEVGVVKGRKFIVKNYAHRNQEIGE
jgi:radical SAM protein with 4Fe4S-binding SPASM domain